MVLIVFFFRYLTTYDCVSFYSFIETVIAANTPQEGRVLRQSEWLYLEAGNRAIEVRNNNNNKHDFFFY